VIILKMFYFGQILKMFYFGQILKVSCPICTGNFGHVQQDRNKVGS
jgi:hypothetical protein